MIHSRGITCRGDPGTCKGTEGVGGESDCQTPLHEEINLGHISARYWLCLLIKNLITSSSVHGNDVWRRKRNLDPYHAPNKRHGTVQRRRWRRGNLEGTQGNGTPAVCVRQQVRWVVAGGGTCAVRGARDGRRVVSLQL